MEDTLQKTRAHSRFVMYVLGFLFTLHYTLPVYINSSFLSSLVGEKYVGLIYTLGALLTLAFFLLIPRLLERFGNFRIIMAMLIIELVSLIGLASSQSVVYVLPLFIASFIVVAIINFNMDIFLENLSSESTVGKIRGFFLTSANIAWIVGPLLTSLILSDSQYWMVYAAAAILILPVIALVGTNLKDFQDPKYIEPPFLETIRDIRKNKNILGSFMISFILQFFFAWMVIYTPLYLHNHIGFSWEEIGVMFSIMLLPFVILEIPLGRLADSRWGEKEIMSIGFIIMAISTGLISFIDIKSFTLWTTILVITRIGASMVEISSETYFFKKVDGASLDFMSFYRTMRPFAYLVSPVIATLIFSFLSDFKNIFIILGIFMFYGLRWSLSLQDTK